jgi:dihydrodipicolinate reductase
MYIGISMTYSNQQTQTIQQNNQAKILIKNTLLVLLSAVVDQYILVEIIELHQSHNYDYPFHTKNQQINKSTNQQSKSKYNNSTQSEKQNENNKISRTLPL